MAFPILRVSASLHDRYRRYKDKFNSAIHRFKLFSRVPEPPTPTTVDLTKEIPLEAALHERSTQHNQPKEDASLSDTQTASLQISEPEHARDEAYDHLTKRDTNNLDNVDQHNTSRKLEESTTTNIVDINLNCKQVSKTPVDPAQTNTSNENNVTQCHVHTTEPDGVYYEAEEIKHNNGLIMDISDELRIANNTRDVKENLVVDIVHIVAQEHAIDEINVSNNTELALPNNTHEQDESVDTANREVEDTAQTGPNIRGGSIDAEHVDGVKVPSEFQGIIDALDLDKLEDTALRIRRESMKKKNDQSEIEWCVMLANQPLSGSYNICYLLRFSDDVHWVVRIPGWGTAPNYRQAEKMTSENNTARYIASKSTFKQPDIYYWNTSPEEIGVAFTLMSYIPGYSLGSLWAEWSEEKRRCAISDIAREMSKLYMFQFDRAGMLRFASDGTFCHVGPEIVLRTVDDVSWAETSNMASVSNTREWIAEDIMRLSQENHRFSRPSWICRTRHSIDVLDDNLEMMFRSIPDYLLNSPLSLSLDDVDFQNVLCDPDTGHVNALIDLDNIAVRPVVVGAAAYPLFLMRDRDPLRWYNDAKPGRIYNDKDFPDLRALYAQAFREALPLHAQYDHRWTRMSHHIHTMETALTFWHYRSMCLDELERTAYSNYYVGESTSKWLSLWKDDSVKFQIVRQRQYRKVLSGLWVDELSPESYTVKRENLLGKKTSPVKQAVSTTKLAATPAKAEEGETATDAGCIGIQSRNGNSTEGNLLSHSEESVDRGHGESEDDLAQFVASV